MPRFKWVHLSDLHIQEEDSFNRSVVLKALWDDLSKREKLDKCFGKIDAVFFTGDLAYHGQKNEYDLAEEEFLNPMLKILEISGDKLFITPGNHDIDVKKVGQSAEGLKNTLINQERVTKFLEDPRDREIAKRKMDDYIDFFERRFPDRKLDSLGWFYTSEVMIQGKRVVILGLNTAWLCTGETSDEPLLGERQIVEALKSAGEAQLTIALFHHPVGKWRDIDDTDLCESQLRDTCGLWLHGHLHKPDVRTMIVPKGRFVTLPAGAVFDKRKSPNSYSIGLIDLETGKGAVFLRKFENTVWLPDLRSSGEEAGGKVPIEVEGLGEGTAGRVKQGASISCTPISASALPSSLNPFTSVAAESMTAEDIRRLFVGRHTKLDIATKRFGTIIEGQRGTGKSMILRYLSFPVQIRDWLATGRNVQDYLDQRKFTGVYCKLPQGVFDKKDLSVIPESNEREKIFEHMLTAYVSIAVFETMGEAIPHLRVSDKNKERFTSRIERIFRIPEEWLRTAKSLEAVLIACLDALRDEARNVNKFLRDPSNKSFNTYLTLTGTLYDLLRLFQECLEIRSTCFFLLIDDFDVLHDWQQQILFSVAAQRDFALVCFKFGIMSEGKKTGLSGPQRTFRPGDDYDPIELDWVEGGLLHSDYPETINLIAAKRLKEARWDSLLGKNLPDIPKNGTGVQEVIEKTETLMRELFPAWEFGGRLKEEVKQEMYQEWEKDRKKPTKKRSDYFSKYGNARYFQTLARKRLNERFAGYSYIKTISSGIIRQYLEICSEILGLAYKRGWLIEYGTGVSPEVQDDAIRNYSEAFFRNLNKGAGAHSKQDLGGKVSSQAVSDLIEALSDLFYERLHWKGHGEPEILAFALKDHDPYVEAILKVCVRESVLQKFSYPPKTARGGRLQTYILNRRLVPRRSLSALRMQGRIEVTSKDILFALRDSKSFVKEFMPKGFSPDQTSWIKE